MVHIKTQRTFLHETPLFDVLRAKKVHANLNRNIKAQLNQNFLYSRRVLRKTFEILNPSIKILRENPGNGNTLFCYGNSKNFRFGVTFASCCGLVHIETQRTLFHETPLFDILRAKKLHPNLNLNIKAQLIQNFPIQEVYCVKCLKFKTRLLKFFEKIPAMAMGLLNYAKQCVRKCYIQVSKKIFEGAFPAKPCFQ